MNNISSKALSQDQINISKKGCKFAPTHTRDIAEKVKAQIEAILPSTKEYRDDDEQKRSGKKKKEKDKNRLGSSCTE